MVDPATSQSSSASSSQEKKTKDGIGPALWLAVQLVWDMGWIIALPAVCFGIAGAALDRKFQSTPVFILLGLAIALVLSFIALKRKLKDILKKRF